MKKVTILGSTGSIGRQTLEVIEKLEEKYQVAGLSAGKNIELLKSQIQKFHPNIVCVKNKDDALKLKDIFKDIKFLYGENGLIELASEEKIDILVVAVSGKIGLKPTIEAIKNGINIALANKETLITAGDIVINLVKKHKVELLPVDSEHSAVFQCLRGNSHSFVNNLLITASGGPFLHTPEDEMKKADISKVLSHPKWNMGKKITVDSASLMNKGLEVIEAHHLFDIDYNHIKVVVHPESIIHSAVEYKDGSVIAQMGSPSMHIPIQYALTYPERVRGIKTSSFDFVQCANLTFFEPDYKKFPLLKLAYQSGKEGGTMPLCLNAVNEEAVMAFLDGKIKFSEINDIIFKIVESYKNIKNPTIDEIFIEDEQVRKKTLCLLNSQ